jgi:hypothetical protein
MIEMLLEFLLFVTNRDKTKWYTFSIFDICLFMISGASYFVLDLKSSPAIGWICIIIMNTVETYYHNKNNSKDEQKS